MYLHTYVCVYIHTYDTHMHTYVRFVFLMINHKDVRALAFHAHVWFS